jgi:hypothetical protein
MTDPSEWVRPVFRSVVIIAASLGSGAFQALVFLVTLNMSLPRTDLAFQPNPLKILSEPFSLWMALYIGIILGTLIAPLALFCLWRSRLMTSALLVNLVVVLINGGVTVVGGWISLPFTIIATVTVKPNASGDTQTGQ